MTELILKTLKKLGIENWIINESSSQSYELFLIKQREDMLRRADIDETDVTVYRDFEADGQKMRGSSQVKIAPNADEREMEDKLSAAYENALNAGNPFFELAEPHKEERACEQQEELLNILREMQSALYKNDISSDSFINSAEITVSRSKKHTLTSRGTDVRYQIMNVKGEFIAQCITPRDVEMYFDFDYSGPNTQALGELAQKALALVKDRAQATQMPVSGNYDVLLCDEQLETLMRAYIAKCDAGMVYAGYSPYKVGTNIHQDEMTGERISIDVFSRAPFSEDGLPMPERPLIIDGVVQGIYGATRFCRYLGLVPSGSYRGLKVKNGTLPISEMKKKGVLMPLAFSDFDCDPLRGTFGGEIRLAYLFGEDGVSILTGGSINGSLSKKQDQLLFSLERFESARYIGPKAVLIPGVTVAGC